MFFAAFLPQATFVMCVNAFSGKKSCAAQWLDTSFLLLSPYVVLVSPPFLVDNKGRRMRVVVAFLAALYNQDLCRVWTL